jgi:hypothetical protein
MNEQDEIKLYMKILHDLREYIAKLREIADEQEESLKTTMVMDESSHRLGRTLIRSKRTTANQLEQILQGKGQPNYYLTE